MIAHLLMLSAAFALPTAEFARYYEKITGKPPADGLVTFAVDPENGWGGVVLTNRTGDRLKGYAGHRRLLSLMSGTL